MIGSHAGADPFSTSPVAILYGILTLGKVVKITISKWGLILSRNFRKPGRGIGSRRSLIKVPSRSRASIIRPSSPFVIFCDRNLFGNASFGKGRRLLLSIP